MRALRDGKVVGLAAGLAALLAVVPAAAEAPRADTGTEFTYQGVLRQDGVPYEGTVDLQFSLWNMPAAGSQVGPTIERTGVVVADGLVTERLDFGDVYANGALWLQIVVTPEGGTATVLSPRQKITPTPMATEAFRLEGHEASFFLDTGGDPQTKTGNLTVDVWDGHALSGKTAGYGNAGVFGSNNDLDTSGGYGVYGQSEKGVGVYGMSNAPDRPGVRGRGPYRGVEGLSSAGTGVYGYATEEDSIGVEARNVDGYGLYAYSLHGTAVYGRSNADGGIGIRGVGLGVGVRGYSWDGTGVLGATEDDTSAGVHGQNPNGPGVKAITDCENATCAALVASALSRDAVGNAGVLAKNYGDGYGVHGVEETGGGDTSAGVFGENLGTGYGVIGEGAAGGGLFEDRDDGTVTSLASGAASTAGTGAKNFVQNHPYDPEAVVVYAALEGPTVDTYTRGRARLVDGRARVALDPTFALVTNPSFGLSAVLTPVGGDPGLYVESVGTSELVVASRDPEADTVFDYVVYGLRIGFEDTPSIRPKPFDAPVPSMAAFRALLSERPDLVRTTARERLGRELVERGLADPPDPDRERELLAAVGEWTPERGPAHPAFRTALRPGDPDPGDAEPAGEPEEAVPGREISGARADRAGREVSPAAAAAVERPPLPRGRIVVRLGDGASAAPGTVIAFDPASGRYGPATEGAATVVGVAVDDPEEGTPGTPVAVAGVVACLVDARYGPVLPGDLLMASPTPGHAMRASDPLPGTVVAKALEPLEDGTGTVRVLVAAR